MTQSRRSGRHRVLILSYTEVARDPRPLKQIAVLKEAYDVTVASYGPAPDPDVAFIPLDAAPPRRGLARIPGIFSLLLVLRRYGLYERLDARNRRFIEQLADDRWDVVVAHDPQSMAVAEAVRPRHGILVDLHEYAAGMSEATLSWRVLHRPYFVWLLRGRVARAAAVTTVNPEIAKRYENEFGFRSHSVVNATPYHALRPGPIGDVIRLVHSGVAAPDRRLDRVVTAVLRSRAAVTMDFYFVETFPEEQARLRELARDDPRIRFHTAVPYRRLVEELNRFDVGVSVIAPTTESYYLALPNKVFDYVQARLGIIVGPSPAMANLVRRHGLGDVASSFEVEDLVAILDRLTPEEVGAWKASAHEHARELAGEPQAAVWRELVDGMVGS